MTEAPEYQPIEPNYSVTHEGLYAWIRGVGTDWQDYTTPEPAIQRFGHALLFTELTTIQLLDGEEELLTLNPNYYLVVYDSPEEYLDTYRIVHAPS